MISRKGLFVIFLLSYLLQKMNTTFHAILPTREHCLKGSLKVCRSNKSWYFPESMNLTENKKRIAQRLKANSPPKMGPATYTEVTVGARPHLYVPILFNILKRMEKVTSIKEPVPQKKASRGFVHRKYC